MLVALLLCSAMMSGTEVAFFSLSHRQITQLKNTQDPSEKKVLRLLQSPKRLLATILILSNLLNVAFVTLSTYLLWSVIDEKQADRFVLLAYTLTSTFLIVLFGEVIPKIYASQNNLRFAKRTTYYLTLALPLLRPLSSLLLRIDQFLGKRFLREKPALSTEKLNRALALTTAQEVSEGEKEILKGVVNFNNLTAKQIMQPRMDIEAIDIEADFHQVIALATKAAHSRFPVYKETIDSIEGVLYAKDLIAHLDKAVDFQWHSLLRKGFFVPENKKLDTLLVEFQEKGVQMAIVVDEYGGTSGLITLEDIIEEIIGDITDEFKQEEMLYQQLDDTTFVLEGKISLNDFCKAIDESPATFEEVKGESESLGGLLLELHGRLPKANEQISFQRFAFTILSADTRKIKKIRVEITPHPGVTAKNR